MATPEPSLKIHRDHLNLLQAAALEMSNVPGVGPFFTIPALMAKMSRPQTSSRWKMPPLQHIAAVCSGVCASQGVGTMSQWGEAR